jgi:branched-subunit amino acid ABC-type transport system permease component
MIPKRVFWFATGAASGFAGAVYAYARVREVQGRLAADRMADTLAETVVGTARSVRGTVREAMDEGRDAQRRAVVQLETRHRPSARRARVQ